MKAHIDFLSRESAGVLRAGGGHQDIGSLSRDNRARRLRGRRAAAPPGAKFLVVRIP
jgi:hypothetical protein